VFDGTRDGFINALRRLPAAHATAGQREFMRRYSVEAAADGIAQALETVFQSEMQPVTPAQFPPPPPPSAMPTRVTAGVNGRP
jgi:hypothetical protein